VASLYTTADVLITDRITAVIPGLDTIKVTNRLLDGSYHFQTIGTGVKVVSASLVATEAAKETIDTYESICTPVKVISGTKYYAGVIKEAPSWDRLAPGLYRASVSIVVSEEGTV